MGCGGFQSGARATGDKEAPPDARVNCVSKSGSGTASSQVHDRASDTIGYTKATIFFSRAIA